MPDRARTTDTIPASGILTFPSFAPAAWYLVQVNLWGAFAPGAELLAYVGDSVRAISYGVPGTLGPLAIVENETLTVVADTAAVGAIVELDYYAWGTNELESFPFAESLPGARAQILASP